MPATIVQKILDARQVVLQCGDRIPNVLILPALDAAQFSNWLQSIERDPFLGFTPIGKQIFGMTIREDVTATKIVCTYESER